MIIVLLQHLFLFLLSDHLIVLSNWLSTTLTPGFVYGVGELLLYQFPWLHLSLWPGAGVDWGPGMLLEPWEEFPWGCRAGELQEVKV